MAAFSRYGAPHGNWRSFLVVRRGPGMLSGRPFFQNTIPPRFCSAFFFGQNRLA